MRQYFTAHPESVGETYTEHMGHAFSFGGAMVLGGMCCLIHALLPFLFEKTGSNIIRNLHDRMVLNRDKRLPRKPASMSACE